MASVTEAERRKLSKSAKNQTHTTSWKRFVLGVFVFACLNVTAQPCLMAMELAPVTEIPSEHSASADHHKHSGHHDDVSDQADCGHCPPGGGEHSKHCSTSAAASCEAVPIPNAEGRSTKLKLKDLSHFPVLPAMPVEQAFFPVLAPLQFLAVERSKHASEPPLNIRYCVYLI